MGAIAAENVVIVQNSPNVRHGEQTSTKKPDRGAGSTFLNHNAYSIRTFLTGFECICTFNPVKLVFPFPSAITQMKRFRPVQAAERPAMRALISYFTQNYESVT